MFRVLFKFVFLAAEKIASEIALLVALLTLTLQGTYDGRFLGALDLIWKIVHGFFAAFFDGRSFIDVMSSFADSARDTIAKAGETIEGDPQTALAAFVGAFILMKLVAFAFRLVRTKLLRKRPKNHSQKPTGSGTYEKLYQGETAKEYDSK